MSDRDPTVTTPPPDHLGTAGMQYWGIVTTDFDLSEPDLELLRGACEMLDRAEQARAIVAAEGLIVRDRWDQPKPHPAAEVERQSRLAFVRIRRELGLDVPPPDSRPPLPPGYR